MTFGQRPLWSKEVHLDKGHCGPRKYQPRYRLNSEISYFDLNCKCYFNSFEKFVTSPTRNSRNCTFDIRRLALICMPQHFCKYILDDQCTMHSLILCIM